MIRLFRELSNREKLFTSIAAIVVIAGFTWSVSVGVVGCVSGKCDERIASIHCKMFQDLHQPLIDTLKKQNEKIDTVKKVMRSLQNGLQDFNYMYQAQYSREQRKLLRSRVAEIRQEDSINKVMSGGSF